MLFFKNCLKKTLAPETRFPIGHLPVNVAEVKMVGGCNVSGGFVPSSIVPSFITTPGLIFPLFARL